jgi:hypothetical protein
MSRWGADGAADYAERVKLGGLRVDSEVSGFQTGSVVKESGDGVG